MVDQFTQPPGPSRQTSVVEVADYVEERYKLRLVEPVAHAVDLAEKLLVFA